MVFPEPDYPHVIGAFTYRGFQLAIEKSEDNGLTVFSVWADHDLGTAIAVPGALSRREAIYKARRWVDQRLNGAPVQSPLSSNPSVNPRFFP
ncbi:MAG: hypothetical protein ACKO21_10460 [Nodosilinea sp.]|jgi:hypothetical protein